MCNWTYWSLIQCEQCQPTSVYVCRNRIISNDEGHDQSKRSIDPLTDLERCRMDIDRNPLISTNIHGGTSSDERRGQPEKCNDPWKHGSSDGHIDWLIDRSITTDWSIHTSMVWISHLMKILIRWSVCRSIDPLMAWSNNWSINWPGNPNRHRQWHASHGT